AGPLLPSSYRGDPRPPTSAADGSRVVPLSPTRGVSTVRRHKLRLSLTLAVAVAALAAAAAATAATLTTTATITGAAGLSLNLPANPSISDTLDGTDQTVSYAPVLGLVDARGSGAGWNMTISATNFSDGAGHTLAPGSVTSVAQACHSGSSCTVGTATGITYPLTIGGTA